MNSTLGFAILGCGRISAKHCDALSRNVKGARLVAVCDVVPERAKTVGTTYSVPYYTNIRQLIEAHNSELDVINILTPSGFHSEHAIALAQYGKHLVVEKPIALTVSDAEAMVRACDAAGVRLFVVKQNRTNPPVVRLKKAIEDGRFGKMVMGTVRVRWCRRQDYYDQDTWRGTWKLDGGVFMNQASHHVDLLTWLLGDVDRVAAYSAKRLVNIETEDTAVAMLKFHSGALGVLEATTATRPRDLEGSISILGEKGSVEIGGFAVNEIKTWNLEDSTPEEQRDMLALRESPPNVYGFGHVRYLSNVVESLNTGKLNAVDGIEGMKSLLLINAMYESMDRGQEVNLFFQRGRR